MLTEKITILGLSEATICMIFDILESNDFYPNVEIINNKKIIPSKKYINPKFRMSEKYEIDESSNNFVLGVTNVKTKKSILDFFKSIQSKNYINLISKKSDLSSTVTLGNGIIINTLSCVAAFTEINNFTFINRGCTIGHHTIIGEHCTINPGVNIAGNVTIGDSTQIGIGTSIFDGVSIGRNTIIGAGSVVTKDIPDNVIAYGSPCKIIKDNI